MEGRNLDITIVSAEDLKKVNLFGKMHTYAVAWVDPYNRKQTFVDEDGGVKPSWNQTLSIPVPEHFFQQSNSHLTVEIFSKGSVSEDKLVGAVIIPLSEIVQKANQDEISTYQVKRRSGKAKGSLRLSIHVGEKTTISAAAPMPASTPVMAYPPSAGAAPYGYPPARAAPYGYPPPPQYPQAFGGYGGQGYYPQASAPPQYYGGRLPRRPGMGGMGMGLGTGLLAGAVGGLLLGEIVDDAFDGGCDGGFDGGFGF